MLDKVTTMEDMINETQELIDTLETLNNEIESYQVAKNNLIDVKEQLHKFINQSSETLEVSKENFIQVNNILNSDLIIKLENLQNGIEKLKSNLNSNIETIRTDFSDKQIQSNKKITLLTILIIVNILITIFTLLPK